MILQLLKYSRDNPLTNLLPAAVSVSNISTPGSDPYPVLGLQSFNITIEILMPVLNKIVPMPIMRRICCVGILILSSDDSAYINIQRQRKGIEKLS